VANICPADEISARRSAIMESPSARVSLGEGGENGSQASRSATDIEDMFSACGKFRPDLPTRNPYRTIRGGRVAMGRVEIPGLRGWQSGGNFNHAGPVCTPKTNPVPRPAAGLARVGRPVRRRPQGTRAGPHLRRRRGLPAAVTVRPAGA
jgi:hypothetical protein